MTNGATGSGSTPAAPAAAGSPPTVALLLWGDVFEDFLDTIGVSLDAFCRELTGGWFFNYADALQRSGIRTVIVAVSARVNTVSRVRHLPTGTPICILPALTSYRVFRTALDDWRRGGATKWDRRIVRWLVRPFHRPLREIAPYLATPLRLLARELRRDGCSAIICQEYEYPRFDACVLLGRLTRRPVFATFQGGNVQRGTLERLARPLAIRAAAGLIVGSGVELDRVRARYHVPPVKLASIVNPFDVSAWGDADRAEARTALGIPHAARVAAWHGRVSIWQKGLDVLLVAWQRIVAERPGALLKLLLVGTGADARELREQIRDARLNDIVWIDRYVLDRTELRRYLAAADVYVFPSRHEGFPVAPLEGMASGLAMVAADAQGVREILAGGEAAGGVVVPRENPAALAAALGRALDDPAWTDALGKRARTTVVTRFSLEAVGSELRAFLAARGARV